MRSAKSSPEMCLQTCEWIRASAARRPRIGGQLFGRAALAPQSLVRRRRPGLRLGFALAQAALLDRQPRVDRRKCWIGAFIVITVFDNDRQTFRRANGSGRRPPLARAEMESAARVVERLCGQIVTEPGFRVQGWPIHELDGAARSSAPNARKLGTTRTQPDAVRKADRFAKTSRPANRASRRRRQCRRRGRRKFLQAVENRPPPAMAPAEITCKSGDGKRVARRCGIGIPSPRLHRDNPHRRSSASS